MKQKNKLKTEKSRVQLLHQYYNYTGFYSFVWEAVKKVLPYIMALVVVVYTVNHFFNIKSAT